MMTFRFKRNEEQTMNEVGVSRTPDIYIDIYYIDTEARRPCHNLTEI